MRLSRIPAAFIETRDALHQLAFFAVAPTRYRAVGRMGLRPAPGGFGTPEFEGCIARVEGDNLVFEKAGNVATQTITNVRDAAQFFGHDYDADWFGDFHDPLRPVDPDEPLPVDDTAARFLGQWFQFGFALLEELGSRGEPDDDVSEVQLWPEHFDPATELGDQEAGRRASYGASPGDADHDQPYIYVAPWGEIDASNLYWNDGAFGGASLGYGELVESDDPLSRGLEFLMEGYRTLRSG